MQSVQLDSGSSVDRFTFESNEIIENGKHASSLAEKHLALKRPRRLQLRGNWRPVGAQSISSEGVPLSCAHEGEKSIKNGSLLRLKTPNHENIDYWLFDWIEGNLSPEQEEQLQLFLLLNPEYEADAEAWKASKINFPVTEELQESLAAISRTQETNKVQKITSCGGLEK